MRAGFLNTRRRALTWISFAIACAVLIAVGGVATLVTLGAKSAAAEVSHPGKVRISLETQLTERAVYPPGIAQGNFDGAYTMATMYKSGIFAGNKVAFWGRAAGALKAGNYPIDEFVYVLEGRSCYGGCRRYPTRISRRSFGHSKGAGSESTPPVARFPPLKGFGRRPPNKRRSSSGWHPKPQKRKFGCNTARLWLGRRW